MHLHRHHLLNLLKCGLKRRLLLLVVPPHRAILLKGCEDSCWWIIDEPVLFDDRCRPEVENREVDGIVLLCGCIDPAMLVAVDTV